MAGWFPSLLSSSPGKRRFFFILPDTICPPQSGLCEVPPSLQGLFCKGFLSGLQVFQTNPKFNPSIDPLGLIRTVLFAHFSHRTPSEPYAAVLLGDRLRSICFPILSLCFLCVHSRFDYLMVLLISPHTAPPAPRPIFPFFPDTNIIGSDFSPSQETTLRGS